MTWDIKTGIRIQYEKPAGTWNSIQCDTFEVDIDRGISVEQNTFARPNVGIATVRLMKSSLGDFLNGPDYASNQRFRIEYDSLGTWEPLFNGFIQNIEMTYVPEAKASALNDERGQLQVTITANDMGRIALNTQIGTFNITGTSTRSFINVMNQLGTAITAVDSRYSQAQVLSGGSSTFQYANTYLDIPSGELYNQFLDAELGWLYASKSGGMRYLTRSDVNTIQGYSWDTNDIIVSNVHSTSNLHVCMNQIDLSYISDGIANQVRVENAVTGVRTTSTNSTSVSLYGRQLADFTVNFDPTVSGGTTFAQWASAVSGAANPKNIQSVSVPVIRRTGFPSFILNEEIGDALQVEFASAGLPTLQERYMITRMNHFITADHWELNLGLWRGV
jgi:hypothetical protein